MTKKMILGIAVAVVSISGEYAAAMTDADINSAADNLGGIFDKGSARLSELPFKAEDETGIKTAAAPRAGSAEQDKLSGLRRFLGLREQHRPAMLERYGRLAGKVMEAGELTGKTRVLRADLPLDDERRESFAVVWTLLAGSHVDEDPATPDVLLERQSLANSYFVSTDIITYIRREETNIFGTREIIRRETQSLILYEGVRQYRFKTIVKIDAKTGAELQDTKETDR